MARIGWDTKETFEAQPAIPEINKFTAPNAEEAKDSVNDLYDLVDALTDDVIAIAADFAALESDFNDLSTEFTDLATSLDLAELVATLAGSDLTLNCSGRQTPRFRYGTLTTNTEILITNDTIAQVISLVLKIDGTVVLGFPSNVRMARYNEVSIWNQTNKELTVVSASNGDLHEISLIKTQSSPIYILKYDGATRP